MVDIYDKGNDNHSHNINDIENHFYYVAYT